MIYDTDDVDLPLTLEDLGMTHGGWCFQTEDDRRNGILSYILDKCGSSPITYDMESAMPWLFEPSRDDDDEQENLGKDEL